MTIPLKSLKSGFSMPIFGFGTWRIGGDYQKNPLNPDKEQIAGIRRAINNGITHIDTAEMYAQGHAEELVGRAIKGYNRKKLFIVSKVWPTHLKFEDLLRSAAASLKRIKTDYLDLYLIHMPNPEVPLTETLSAMDKLKEDGLIKNIGVSNFTVKTFTTAQNLTHNKIVANQVHYNLIYREPEISGLLEFCQKNDVLLVAWRPVEKGILAKTGTELLDGICAKYAKTSAQIAINWLASQKNVITLAKMVDKNHLLENLGALNWQMDKRDIEKLRQFFPGQKQVSEAVPLA
ncbi:hypothetical protein A2153_02425 [Candidatus Gottesmanbacteria bacterium RBG_16_38_7b]|uniref:NADP-dependent oxidoreductase domain-containing protein n=1 Tax=Candidatus Gottesmanbacteria bacterium RBG_16_38_7b TaxID=1798372 RepID=A0A1F5YL14_9BACT|nr:MAG: hypothetical protein A2153_02425 [Candidatus Gottesmanbacteria bacterium RBG_16_38_7b]